MRSYGGPSLSAFNNSRGPLLFAVLVGQIFGFAEFLVAAN